MLCDPNTVPGGPGCSPGPGSASRKISSPFGSSGSSGLNLSRCSRLFGTSQTCGHSFSSRYWPTKSGFRSRPSCTNSSLGSMDTRTVSILQPLLLLLQSSGARSWVHQMFRADCAVQASKRFVKPLSPRFDSFPPSLGVPLLWSTKVGVRQWQIYGETRTQPKTRSTDIIGPGAHLCGNTHSTTATTDSQPCQARLSGRSTNAGRTAIR